MSVASIAELSPLAHATRVAPRHDRKRLFVRPTPRNTDSRDVQIALLTEAGGGVMRHIIDLHRGLTQRGWKSTLIVSPTRMDDRYRHEIDSFAKGEVSFVEMARSPHKSDIGAYFRLKAILGKMSGRRVLHTHSTKAGMLGTLLQSEVDATTYTPHAYRATDPSLGPAVRRVLRGVEMAYSRPYDRIISVSRSEMDYTLQCGVDPDRVTCIPNGIHFDGSVSDGVRNRRSTAPKQITLGFVGRLAHQKDPLLFVQTLSHLVKMGHDAKGVVVGDGYLRAEMMTTAEQLNVSNRIDWRGEIPAHQALQDMDILVHTSRYEALPYTLLEACASLLPIVATDNHGSRSVLQGELEENIVAEATPEALCGRILELANHPAMWSRQLYLLEQTAHAFSLERMVTKVEHLYLDLLSSQHELSRSMQQYLMPSISRIQPFA